MAGPVYIEKACTQRTLDCICLMGSIEEIMIHLTSDDRVRRFGSMSRKDDGDGMTWAHVLQNKSSVDTVKITITV